MAFYYVNAKPKKDGRHEVHEASCAKLKKAKEKINLGLHSNCCSAIKTALKTHPTADGCYYCCPRCHNAAGK